MKRGRKRGEPRVGSEKRDEPRIAVQKIWFGKTRQRKVVGRGARHLDGSNWLERYPKGSRININEVWKEGEPRLWFRKRGMNQELRFTRLGLGKLDKKRGLVETPDIWMVGTNSWRDIQKVLELI